MNGNTQPKTKKFKPFKPYSLRKAFKKFHYPFKKVEVEPIEPFKGSIAVEADCASTNLTFLLLHGLFMLIWYCIVWGIYFYYIIGYSIYWFFSSIIAMIKNRSSNAETTTETTVE